MEIQFRFMRRKYLRMPKSKENYVGTNILTLRFGKFGFNWFTDSGNWFFYIYLNKSIVRFSSAGFMVWRKD